MSGTSGLAGAHESSQIRWAFDRSATGVRIVPDSQLALDLHEKFPDRFEHLGRVMDDTVRHVAGAGRLDHVIMARDEAAYAGAIREARAADPLWRDHSTAGLDHGIEQAVRSQALTRANRIILSDGAARHLPYLTGRHPQELFGELPHLLLHEGGHLNPDSHLGSLLPGVRGVFPMEEAWVDFLADDADVRERTLREFDVASTSRARASGHYSTHVAALREGLTLLGHDLSSQSTSQSTREAVRGRALTDVALELADTVIERAGRPASEASREAVAVHVAMVPGRSSFAALIDALRAAVPRI